MSNNPYDKLTIMTANAYQKSRGMYSPVFHIEKENGSPLCGERSLPFGVSPVTVAEVLDNPSQLPNGWHWCGVCASIFTGESVELFFQSHAVIY